MPCPVQELFIFFLVLQTPRFCITYNIYDVTLSCTVYDKLKLLLWLENVTLRFPEISESAFSKVYCN